MPRISTRRTCEDMHRVDVRNVARDGILNTGNLATMTWIRGGTRTGSMGFRGCGGSVELVYRVNGESVCESVGLYWTPCNYGGERPWFRCPKCSRRCAVLYGGPRFWCRSCHALDYRSQRENGEMASARRIKRALKRLKMDTSGSLGTPPRPKGMWHRTYDQQLAEYHAGCAALLPPVR